MLLLSFLASHWFLTILVEAAVILVVPSIRIIGPTEVGLVTKRFSLKKLPDDNPIAFQGEAGYQADLLMPGWHFRLWIVYLMEKHPWVQVRAGEIGIVVAQVGRSLPTGAKSAESMSELNLITNLHAWLQAGGQKGVQRPVLPPGSLMPIHPVGFIVLTRERVYGVPIAREFQYLQARGKLTYQAFGLTEEQLKVTVITPRTAAGGKVLDTCGIVTTLEGEPLPAGAPRLVKSENHFQNWFDCIKSGDRPVADVEIGHRSATICHLINITRWLGRRLQWDQANEVFPHDAEANKYLDHPRRKPYELPEIV